MRKLIAIAVAAGGMLVPAAAASAATLSVGDVGTGDVLSDNCTNININTGVEEDKTQECK